MHNRFGLVTDKNNLCALAHRWWSVFALSLLILVPAHPALDCRMDTHPVFFLVFEKQNNVNAVNSISFRP